MKSTVDDFVSFQLGIFFLFFYIINYIYNAT